MDRPRTPPHQWFVSPIQTPQGSPSKRQMPPGANALSDILEGALNLSPIAALSPNKAARAQQLPPVLSPRASNIPCPDDNVTTFDNSVQKDDHPFPSSPRKTHKENTALASQGKDSNYPQSPAAASRQEFYQPRQHGAAAVAGARKQYETQRGLSVDELEKLQKPQVKRLANVTQLCQFMELAMMHIRRLIFYRLFGPLLRPTELCSLSSAATHSVQISDPISARNAKRGI